MYQSLRAAADARKCAQYVTENYASSVHDGDITGSSGTNKAGLMQQSHQPGSSNEGSVTNINITTGHNGHTSSSGSIHMNHDPAPPVITHRNSDEYHHYPLIQQPPPSQPQSHHRYNQHYAGVNNHDPSPHRPHIKQNSPALLSIAQASHQAYSGKSLKWPAILALCR